ncbi:hypothetical protein TNCV_3045001 [Trichonephila clavipes]|nr:hypothetical protein TNCV_3045001 [Trichonephila clavipes]
MHTRRPSRSTGNHAMHLVSWHRRAYLRVRWSRSTIPFEEGSTIPFDKFQDEERMRLELASLVCGYDSRYSKVRYPVSDEAFCTASAEISLRGMTSGHQV